MFKISSSQERSLLLIWVINTFVVFLEIKIFVLVFGSVENINYLFGSILNHVHKAFFFVSTIKDQFGYFIFELFIFLACLIKIIDVLPKFLTILKIYKKLCQVWVLTVQGITHYFSWTIFNKFYKNWSIAAFSEGESFRIWEKYEIAVGHLILANQDVEDVEADFIEEIRDYLIDMGGSLVLRLKSMTVLWKLNWSKE